MVIIVSAERILIAFALFILICALTGCPASTKCESEQMKLGRRMSNAIVGLKLRLAKQNESEEMRLRKANFPEQPMHFTLTHNKLTWSDGFECFINLRFSESLLSSIEDSSERVPILIALPSQIACGDRAIVAFRDESYEVILSQDLVSLPGLDSFTLEKYPSPSESTGEDGP